MSGCKRKAINSYGDFYEFPKDEINNIDQLKPGDHVAFEQRNLYWHHMIVEKIDKEQKIIHVIHFFNTPEGFLETFPSKATVRQDEFRFGAKRLHRIVYDENYAVNDAEKVLMKARKYLRSSDYNAFGNNCEHFCSSCKINKHDSSQVKYLEFLILKYQPMHFLRLIGDVLMVARSNLPGFLARGVVTGALKCIVNAFGMVFEFVIVGIEIAIVGSKNENGEITDEKYYESVVKKLVNCYFVVVFCAIGHMIIPIPIVGCIVGTILGQVVGFIASSIVFSKPSLWKRLKYGIKRASNKINIYLKCFTTNKLHDKQV